VVSRALAARVVASLVIAGGCEQVAGLSEFHPAVDGGGAAQGGAAGGGGAPVTGGAEPGGAAPLGGGGGQSDCATDLLIAEIRTYGVGNGDDDFVEIYNPTSASMSLEDVSIWAYKPGNTVMPRWQGDAGDVIDAGGRFVVGGMGFDLRLLDAPFEQSIGDSQIVLLRRGQGAKPATIDHVCICTNDCGQVALWGGCPGVLPNPAWVSGAITSIPDSLARVPDCIDTNTDADFDDGPPTPGEANE
jgi:hypothetical protein